MPRQISVEDESSLKELPGVILICGEFPERCGELTRIAPQVRAHGVQRDGAGRRERSAGHQNAPALFRPRCAEQVARPHRQHGRENHHSRHAKVDQQTDPDSEHCERPNRVPCERPVSKGQDDHEHRGERQVPAVEERVRVQAGVQQEQQHRQERQRPAPEQPARQQEAREAAAQIEQMRSDVTKQEHRSNVVQMQDALDRRKRQFEHRAEVLLLLLKELVPLPQDVLQIHLPERPIEVLVTRDAVVVDDRGAHQEEKDADRKRPRPVRNAGRKVDHGITPTAKRRHGLSRRVSGRHGRNRIVSSHSRIHSPSRSLVWPVLTWSTAYCGNRVVARHFPSYIACAGMLKSRLSKPS